MVPTSRPQPHPRQESSQTDVPGATTHIYWAGVVHSWPSLLVIHKPWLLGFFRARSFGWCVFGVGSSSLLREIRCWCDPKGYRKYCLLPILSWWLPNTWGKMDKISYWSNKRSYIDTDMYICTDMLWATILDDPHQPLESCFSFGFMRFVVL